MDVLVGVNSFDILVLDNVVDRVDRKNRSDHEITHLRMHGHRLHVYRDD